MQTLNKQEIIEEWIAFVDRNITSAPLDLIDETLALLKDQPDVVRCKDCKWWDKIEDSSYGYCHACKHCCSTKHWEIRIYREYKGDWFCADGERK